MKKSRLEIEREKLLKENFGDVSPVLDKPNIKLGRSDYEALIDLIVYQTKSFNYKQHIRLLLKLGAKKQALMLIDDYEEDLSGNYFRIF
tara:strand:- start:1660 stop:1926 length:267 start_codon:yes stop_codon:yes gene_type:complete